MARIITLTSDFGKKDGYAAAMKGTILSIVPPSIRLVDISHDIAAQDIMEAAFVMKNATPHFPDGTIHLAVIDPGVGTDRRPIAVRHGSHCYVGPDNGLITLVLNTDIADEMVELTNPRFWSRPDPSATFHGRDVFAPVAAHLASGVSLSELGFPIDRMQPMHWALPIADDKGVRGWVVHIDRFGNCITNITEEQLSTDGNGRATKCYVGNAILTQIHRTYADVAPGEPVTLFDSSGNLEIAINCGNAAQLLGIAKGSPVSIIFVDERQEAYVVQQR
ncbi:MAG: SAM-dependent chlorinase/fluorinase [Rhodothermales bacterium]|nr:SAM-dependent chlorinase/fluorinase [Rhodothermales bacterium]